MGKAIRKKRKAGEVFESLEKVSVVLKGNKSSETLSALLPELHKFREPNSVLLSKKHQDAHPFEKQVEFEAFLNKRKAALFVYGNNSKKRPNNLVFGRTFNGETLDLLEFEVAQYAGARDYSATFHLGLRPLLVFQGDLFEVDPTFARIKNFFIDFFGKLPVREIDKRSLNHSIVFSATESQEIHFHYYAVEGAALSEIGPSFKLKLRRTRTASEKTMKVACRQPKLHKKVKNIATTPLKEKKGKVHIQQQDIKTIALKKRKS